jgi:hypothetical protein
MSREVVVVCETSGGGSVVKRISGRLFPGLMMLSLLAACGSESKVGSASSSAGASPAAAGVVTRTVDLGTAVGANAIPFWDQAYTRAQYLYTPAEIRGTGRLTALRQRRSAPSANLSSSCPQLSVRLGHTNLAALTTTFASNFETGQGSLVTVINNLNFAIPAGPAGEWIDLPLQVPFDYNGVDNLVVEFEKLAACTPFLFVDTQAAANRRVITATQGATTGTLDSSRIMARFAFSGGETKVDFGGAGGNIFPFGATIQSPRTQNLYLASEVSGAGLVTGVAFQLNTISPGPPGGNYTYSLKLGHSTLSSLGATFASNYSDSPVTVATAVSFTIPAGIPAGEWVWIPIPDGAFSYNGIDNLLVEVATSTGTKDTILRAAVIPGRRLFLTGSGSGTAVTGTVDDTAYHLMLRFNGGPVSVVTDGGASTGLAFSPAAAGRLNLYRAVELGTAGSITSVGCRMANTASSASSYANYQVIIGHSAVDSLVAASASDFISQATALSGTVLVPPGLSAGDWIEVSLPTPFLYDGRSNLAVWMGTTAASGAAGTHNCRVSTSNTPRYPGQMASGAPGTATVGPQDFKFDMKLNISR